MSVFSCYSLHSQDSAPLWVPSRENFLKLCAITPTFLTLLFPVRLNFSDVITFWYENKVQDVKKNQKKKTSNHPLNTLLFQHVIALPSKLEQKLRYCIAASSNEVNLNTVYSMQTLYLYLMAWSVQYYIQQNKDFVEVHNCGCFDITVFPFSGQNTAWGTTCEDSFMFLHPHKPGLEPWEGRSRLHETQNTKITARVCICTRSISPFVCVLSLCFLSPSLSLTCANDCTCLSRIKDESRLMHFMLLCQISFPSPCPFFFVCVQ